jgi:hypothetical protein
MDVSDRLTEIATFYNGEARRCAKSSAYLAACVMQVSALEAALQAMCFMYPQHVKRTQTFQRKRFRKSRYRALELSLYELINIANELAWFPTKKVTWGKRTTLAGFAHEIRKLRNFVHAGVWARERKPRKFSRRGHAVILEVFDVATDWLVHRIHQDLRKRIGA